MLGAPLPIAAVVCFGVCVVLHLCDVARRARLVERFFFVIQLKLEEGGD